jgi:hypothetical protein
MNLGCSMKVTLTQIAGFLARSERLPTASSWRLGRWRPAGRMPRSPPERQVRINCGRHGPGDRTCVAGSLDKGSDRWVRPSVRVAYHMIAASSLSRSLDWNHVDVNPTLHVSLQVARLAALSAAGLPG